MKSRQTPLVPALSFSRVLFLTLCCVGYLFLQPIQGCGNNPTDEAATESTTEGVGEASQEPTQGKEAGSDNGPDAGSEATPEASPEAGPEPGPEAGAEPSADADPEAGPEAQGETTPETPGETQPEQSSSKTPVAFVFNSNFVNGSFSLVNLTTQKLVKEWTQLQAANDLDSDFAIQVIPPQAFLIDRTKGLIYVLELDNKFNLRATVTLGAGTNPHAVAVAGNKLYVTQYDKASIMVFEENKQPVSIDLSSLAETSTKSCTQDDECTKFGAGSKTCDTTKGVCQSDGIPELDAMIVVGTKLYVLVQALDRNDGYTPSKSSIAVIDTTTDKLTKTLDLFGANPTGFVKEPNGTYLVASTVSSLAGDDGGLERLDPSTDALGGNYVITEKELGGNFSFPNGVVIVSSSVGYAVINDSSFKQSLVMFDPSTGKKTKDILTGQSLSAIALTPNGDLLLGDKGTPSGIRVYDASNGTEKTNSPISTGASLPPANIIFGEIDLKQVP